MASSSNKSILDDNHTDDEVISFSGPGERAELDESDVQQNSDDEEDGAYEEQMKAIARKKINKKHTPVQKPGTLCVDDGNYDRSVAKVGEPDLSKLTITLPTERRDPNVPGAWIPSEKLTWTYRPKVDWKSKESVAKLNNWRSFNLNRKLSPKHEPWEVWLESERDYLHAIVKDHLTRQTVGGRWDRLNWPSITAEYNSIVKGTTQRAGQMTAKRGYGATSGRHAVSASRPLTEDRTAPERSESVCRNQIEQFLGDDIQKMVKDARAKAEETDSESDNLLKLKKHKTKGTATETAKRKGKGKEKAVETEATEAEILEWLLNKSASEGGISDWDLSDWDESGDDEEDEQHMAEALARSRA